MHIERGLKTSRLLGATRECLVSLSDRFAFLVEGHQFTKAFKKRQWDGKYRFFSSMNGKFPTGLLSEVLEAVEGTTVTDKVELPELCEPICDSLLFKEEEGFRELRPYQLLAADSIINHVNCIVKAATNAGKTEIMAEVIRRLNLHTVVVVQRKELLHQTAARLQLRLGVPVGKVGDGWSDVQRITVAMPTTACRGIKKRTGGGMVTTVYKLAEEFETLANAQLLVYDECHNIGDIRAKTLIEASNATYRVAMSGTPFGSDEVLNHTLKGFFGPVAFEITNAELIDHGVSAVPTCKFVTITEPGLERSDYPEAYKLGIVTSSARNEAITKLTQEHVDSGQQVLIIVREIEHGEILSMMLGGARFIHGGLPSDDRIAGLKDFQAGDIRTLISSTILDEGVDVSNINVLILAGGGATAKRVLQRIGRGLRKKEDVNTLTVIDFLDSGNKHLVSHSSQRYATMKAEGFKTLLLKI